MGSELLPIVALLQNQLGHLAFLGYGLDSILYALAVGDRARPCGCDGRQREASWEGQRPWPRDGQQAQKAEASTHGCLSHLNVSDLTRPHHPPYRTSIETGSC